MENDINNLDPNDEGLKGIFGDRFHDATQPPVKKAPPQPVEAQREFSMPSSDWLTSLKACAKHAVIFGGLSILVFYWQQADLMDSSVAVPTMLACAALAGLGVGRNVHR